MTWCVTSLNTLTVESPLKQEPVHVGSESPAAQGVHIVAPGKEVYPVEQAMQLDCDAESWKVPAGHEVQALAPSNEYVPEAQAVQAADPGPE